MDESSSHLKWDPSLRRSVLIVDDRWASYEEAIRDLASFGYMRVSACKSLLKASKHLSEMCPDVVLVNVDLDREKSFGFVSELRALGNYSVIAFTSTSVCLETIKRSIWAGADDFFVKNENTAILSEIIALSQRRHVSLAQRAPAKKLVDSTFLRCVGLVGFERELIDAFYAGFPCQKELAWRIGKSYTYVRKTFSRIYVKFGVENQSQLAGMLTLCAMFGPCGKNESDDSGLQCH